MEVERQYREFSKRTRVHGNTNGAYRPLNNVERLNMARALFLLPPPFIVSDSVAVAFVSSSSSSFLHRAVTIATGIRLEIFLFFFFFFIPRRTRRKGARYTIRLVLPFFNCSRKLFSSPNFTFRCTAGRIGFFLSLIFAL